MQFAEGPCNDIGRSVLAEIVWLISDCAVSNKYKVRLILEEVEITNNENL